MLDVYAEGIKIDASFSEEEGFEAVVVNGDAECEASIDIGAGKDIPVYEGTYEIVPQVDSQELPTKNKQLIDNITIKQIPYYSVSNTSNGQTAIIGMMEDNNGL